jgi:sugar phosphate isomerase/epimerase
MYIGIVTAMMRWEPSLLDQLVWARDNGFDCIELSCWHSAPAGFDGLWAHRWDVTDGYLRQLDSVLQDFERINLHASFFHAYDPTYCTFHPMWRQSALDEMRYALGLAGRFGGRVVTCHPNGLIHGKTEDERRASFLDAVAQLDDMAREQNVWVGLEAIQYLLPLEYCRMLMDAHTTHIGLTLDIGHAHLNETAPPLCMHSFDGPAYRAFGSVANFIREMSPLIRHVHIHDSDGTVSHLPLGTGRADLVGCVSALQEARYAGVISLEAEGPAQQQLTYREMVQQWIADAAAVTRNT